MLRNMTRHIGEQKPRDIEDMNSSRTFFSSVVATMAAALSSGVSSVFACVLTRLKVSNLRAR